MNVFDLLRKPKEVDELALARARERGARAATLMRDETLAEAFTRVEQVYMAAWRGSGVLDVEMRERAHIAVNLLGDLKRQLLAYVEEGEAAANKLEAELRHQKRATLK